MMKKSASEDAHERDRLARFALDAMSGLVVLLDANGNVRDANKVALDAVGADLAAVVGRPFPTTPWWQTLDSINAELRDAIARAVQGTEVRWDTSIVGRAGRNEPLIIDASLQPIVDERGHVAFILFEGRDITQRHVLERASFERRAESAQQFQQLIAGVADVALYMLDRNGVVASWNPGAARIKGYTAREIIGQHFSRFYSEEDQQAGVPERALETAVSQGKYEAEAWRVRKDGTKFWANVLIDPIRDSDGDIIGFAKITRDMTEKRAMQEQLQQSQKMEAIGQLTGGVAHDFNNLLTVILGNLDTVSRLLPASEMRLQRAIDQATLGAQRAATLTSQLLAFSRRQPLNPKRTDVNQLVIGMSDLIRRSLGENIEVEHRLSPDLWPVEVDAHHLESALLNLAVNARDAMPTGGRLTIETSNTHIDTPFSASESIALGDYVAMTIRDSGTGMTLDVRARAFDPFFTTKPIGQGTGLGLSQVFGFVRQSGGHIELTSEVGRGTTVHIYLPRSVAAIEPAEPQRVDDGVPVGDRSETILVVEDDDGVRQYSVESLRELGFSILEAAHGTRALEILDAHPEVSLLFTDVGLPGMNGGELVREVRRRRPKLKVLFTTGYARDALENRGRLDPGIGLLTKPFTRAELGARLREVLDG
jgi:PAS domain S-box-containing protein